MGKNKRAIIITNGDIHHPKIIKKHIKSLGFDAGDTVISADGGAKNAIKLGLDTRIVTGDMDSIEEGIKKRLRSKGVRFVTEKPEKDYSDTHLALREAIKEGADKIIILAAIGSRVDHSLANLHLLADPFLSKADISIVTETEHIFAVQKPVYLKGGKGKRLSLFSLTPYTFFTETRGLKYRLENEKLLFSPIRGISNIFEQDTAFLGIKEGIVLIVKEI